MPKIIFHNQPKLSEHEVDREFNERRVALVPLIEDFVSSSNQFKDGEVEVTFSDKGVSSLVCFLKTASRKLVLKVPLSLTGIAGEALFLKAWEKVGVKVPHVFSEGMLGNHNYLLIEYIDAPMLAGLNSHEEMIEKGIYLEMGQTLRLMHEPKGQGWGKVVSGRGEYDNFTDWLGAGDTLKRIEYVKDNQLLGSEHGSLEKAFALLMDYVGPGIESSYCHLDFGCNNIFATQPITVFDPNPQFSHGVIDVGRTIVNHLALGIFPQPFVDGYFNGEVYDKQVLQASILFSALIKLPYQHKRHKTEFIQNIQKYLRENSSLL